jgi:dihydropteroate synthase
MQSLSERLNPPGAAPPLLMGILNIGNDSVADPLHLRTLGEQVRRAEQLLGEGADIIDIGVQSGRTDTKPISEVQELEALLPLLAALAEIEAPLSVETWRAGVAARAVEAGASIINDVSGLGDLRMADAAAQSGALLVVMHTRARPKEVNFPHYDDVVDDVVAFLRERCAAALDRGVKQAQLILDPGLDFAKTPAQSVALMRRLGEVQAVGAPILLAVSRKYFVGMITDAPPEDRLAGTLAAVAAGVDAGAGIVRVHDVAAVRDFLAVRAVLSGDAEPIFKGSPDAERLKWLQPKGA